MTDYTWEVSVIVRDKKTGEPISVLTSHELSDRSIQALDDDVFAFYNYADILK